MSLISIMFCVLALQIVSDIVQSGSSKHNDETAMISERDDDGLSVFRIDHVDQRYTHLRPAYYYFKLLTTVSGTPASVSLSSPLLIYSPLSPNSFILTTRSAAV